jgi:hypothetical protein
MSLIWMDGWDTYGSTGDTSPYVVDNGIVNILTSGGRFASGGAVECQDFAGRLRIPNLPAISTRFFFGAHLLQENSGSGNDQQLVEIGDSGATGVNAEKSSGGIVTISNEGDTNTTTVRDANGNSWDISSSWPSLGSWFYLEIAADVNAASSNIVVRIDGSEILNVTGATDNSGNVETIILGSGNHPDTSTWDDTILMDDQGTQNNGFLGPRRIVTLRPNATGDSADWSATGSATNYENVDEAPGPNGDTDYNSSGTSGDLDLFNHEDISLAVNEINAVQVQVKGKNAAGTGQTVAPTVKSGTTVSNGTSTQISSSNYTAIRAVFENDPDTGSAWTKSGVNNAQAGYDNVT